MKFIKLVEGLFDKFHTKRPRVYDPLSISFDIVLFFVGDESNDVDFSPADMKLSVQELKLQDGDQLIAVDRSLRYVLEILFIFRRFISLIP